MRVTNAIMVNTSLTNLQKSLNALQTYQTQVQTGKKISTASEDPVVASKSMRYKTRLYEIDQYNNNLNEANSWLSSTETTLSSTYSILKKMRELVEDCSSETITDSDRTQSLIELKQLRLQLAQEANTNVAGRYILSGFKTDTQVMFTEDTEITYDLKESLDYRSADSINANESGTIKGYSIKLQYGTIADGAISKITLRTSTDDIKMPSELATDNSIMLHYVDQADSNAYNVQAKDDPDNDGNPPFTYHINVIKDTGELVFNEDDYYLLSGNLDVEYTKNRFSDGDLNPVHYLQCSEKVTLANTNIGKIQNKTINLEKTGGIKENSVKGLYINGTMLIDENGEAVTGYTLNYCKSTDKTPLAANEIRICTDSGDIKFNALDNQVVQVTSYYKAETDPSTIVSTSEVKYTDNLVGTLNKANSLNLTNKGTIDNNSISGLVFKRYDAIAETSEEFTDAEIVYCKSTDTMPPIPDTSKKVYVFTDTGNIQTGKYFEGCEVYIKDLYITKNKSVNEEIKFEINSNSNIVVNTLAKDVFTTSMIKELDLLINRIENMPRDEVTEFLQHGLTQIDEHIEEVLKQTSNVGSKVNRLELIESRLKDDRINFKDLQSENEDVDEAEAATNLAIQELVYNAALQATSKVLQTSLLDFLQ